MSDIHTDESADAEQGAASKAPDERPLRRLFTYGVLPGVFVYLLLFGLSVLLHRSTDYMGVEDAEVTGRIIGMFEDAIIAQQLSLLGLYVALGSVAGLLAHGVLEARRLAKGRFWPGKRRWWTTALVVIAIHSWFLMRSCGIHPAVYAPQASASPYLALMFWLGVDFLPMTLIDFAAAAFLGAGLWWTVGAARRRLRAAKEPASPGGVRQDAGSGSELLGSSRDTPPRRGVRGLLLGVAAAGLGIGILIRISAPGTTNFDAARDASRPNILIIAVDSLRSDMVDDVRKGSPNITAFADRSVWFRRAYSVMPRTFPSWASILTGRYPHHHGVRHMFPKPGEGPIVEGSVAATLAARGYRTAVFSDFAGDIFTRGDFGFQTVHAPEFTLASNVALGGLKLHIHLLPYLIEVLQGEGFDPLMAFERLGDPFWLTDRALDWVGSGDKRPFLLTVFYSAGHFPFASPAPYYDKFVDPGASGPSRFHKSGFISADAIAIDDKRHIHSLYRGAIAASDAAIGELLATLDAEGVLDNTLVIITADHGENLYEHGLGVGHGDHLYGLEGLEVPLIIHWPGMLNPGARIDQRVALIDIAPTLLAWLGVPSPTPFDGIDLGPVIDGRAVLPRRPIFAETGLTFFPPETRRLDGKRIAFAEGFDAFTFNLDTWEIYLQPQYHDTAVAAKHRMMLLDDYKLLYIPTREGVKWELYNIAADRGDTIEQGKRNPALMNSLKPLLYEWMLQDPNLVRQGEFVVPAGPTATVTIPAPAP